MYGAAASAAALDSLLGRTRASDDASLSTAEEEEDGPLAQDHDHSGDDLGVVEPVSSITVDDVSITNFDDSSTFVVFKDEENGIWKSMRTSSQTVEFEGEDGAVVINDTIDELEGIGNVASIRVVPSSYTDPTEGWEYRTTMETDTTIELVTGNVGLFLEKGILLDYTGDEAAVDLGGNQLRFEFDIIESAGKYCIRDLGSGASYINGDILYGATDSLWFFDAENAVGNAAINYVNVRWFHCQFRRETPYGIRMTDAEGVGNESHRFDIGSIFRPGKKGIVIGQEGVEDTHSFHTFYVDIDATQSTERLVEIHDNENGVLLEGFTPARAGDWDVEITDESKDSYVAAVGASQLLRVKRDSIEFQDKTKSDPFRHEVFEIDLLPDSLAAYEATTRAHGDISLDAGSVTLTTGQGGGSFATLQRPIPFDYANMSFTNQAALQTSLHVGDNDGQEGWIVWGEPDGQAVGWHLEDDRLEGYVSDGTGASTVPLVDDIQPGETFNLTAFYSHPTDVHYYVRPFLEEELTTPAHYEEPQREGLNRVLRPESLGSIDENIPAGREDANIALTIELANTRSGSRTLEWSHWRNHQYPLQGRYNPFRTL